MHGDYIWSTDIARLTFFNQAGQLIPCLQKLLHGQLQIKERTTSLAAEVVMRSIDPHRREGEQ